MKKNKLFTAKVRVLTFAIACSAPYLGLLQPAMAQQLVPHFAPHFAPQANLAHSFAYQTRTPSAWNNVFLSVEASQAASLAHYRAPKIQFNTAQSSLGLRLGYRLTPNLSLSSYYGKTKFGEPSEAFKFSTSHMVFATEPAFKFMPSFNASRFNATQSNADLAAHLNVLKRLTLFGSAGIVNYNHADYGNTKLAKLGLGMQYDFNARLGLRLEMERFRPLGASSATTSASSFSAFNSAYGSLDSYSLGAVFKF